MYITDTIVPAKYSVISNYKYTHINILHDTSTSILKPQNILVNSLLTLYTKKLMLKQLFNNSIMKYQLMLEKSCIKSIYCQSYISIHYHLHSPIQRLYASNSIISFARKLLWSSVDNILILNVSENLEESPMKNWKVAATLKCTSCHQ